MNTPTVTFDTTKSYCVNRGTYVSWVFTPTKISRCGCWAWIMQNVRVHIKHVDIVSNNPTKTPYHIPSVIKARSKSTASIGYFTRFINFITDI